MKPPRSARPTAALFAASRCRTPGGPCNFPVPEPPNISKAIRTAKVRRRSQAEGDSLTYEAEPPAGGSRRGFGGCHDRFRRSWIEVSLPAEHRGPDALVVDSGDAGPWNVRLHCR